MSRSPGALTGVVAALILALPTVSTAQHSLIPTVLRSQAPSRNLAVKGASFGALNPTIVRADAPLPGSGDPDPSLANVYNFTTPDGTKLNGVANYIVPDPFDLNFIFSCSASRIGPRSILTAAHCVTDDQTGALFSTTGNSFARFLQPGSTDASPSWFYTPNAASVIVNPFWQGFDNPNTYLATDLAVVNFATDLPSWITTYGLYTDFPIDQKTTHAGFGTFGGGNGPTDFDFGRRWGTNQVDYIPTDPNFSDFLDLYTDFDDPAGHYDTFCLFGLPCNTGIFSEAGTASGDSGGPLFVDGLIAGVTSFGTYVCDPSVRTHCQPLVSDPSRPFDSFGSLHGFAPVFANSDFIESAISTPEPTTVTFMAIGLLAMGGVARRRSRRS